MPVAAAGRFLGLTLRAVVSVRRISRSVEGAVMDMTVMQIGSIVVAELRTAGFMESTIGQYAKTIKALSEFASERAYSVELGAEFAAMTISPRTGRFSAQRRFDYRRLVGVFDSYVQTGRVDLSVRGRGGGGPWPTVNGFVELDATWEARITVGTSTGQSESFTIPGARTNVYSSRHAVRESQAIVGQVR